MKTKKGGTKKQQKKHPKVLANKIIDKYWHRSVWRKVLVLLIAFVIATIGTMYAVAQWYIHKHASEPLVIGATFVPDYAESFGLDPQDTLNAIFSDLNVKHVRLVSYWKDIEPTPGNYDFSGLDWQFAMANKYHAKVSLAVGLRQPRWPECHEPDWVNVTNKNTDQWESQLFSYMTEVVNRYKDNPALESYQLENEFFMKVFGQCKDFSRTRLVEEYNMVKKIDPHHKVIISRSNNWVGLPLGDPTPDEFSVSVYKRVWDATLTHRYFEYPQPAWTYASLAGAQEILTGRDMIVHELQAEPWPPRGQDIVNTPLSEQFKSMNAKRLKDRISYGEGTGMRTLDLWGVEWMYWLKQEKNHPEVWNVAKDAIKQADINNQKLAHKQ